MRRRSGVIAAVAQLALAGCADPVEEAEIPVEKAETDPQPDGPVTLRATGDGWPQANIRYTAADETSQIEKVDVSWETELEYESDRHAVAVRHLRPCPRRRQQRGEHADLRDSGGR